MISRRVFAPSRQLSQEAALAINPSEFGFAPGVSILVVDLSHVKNPEMLKQISATFQDCRRCGEVRWHPQKPLVALNTTMKESEIQFMINSTHFPVEYVWSHIQSPRVLVVPQPSVVGQK